MVVITLDVFLLSPRNKVVHQTAFCVNSHQTPFIFGAACNLKNRNKKQHIYICQSPCICDVDFFKEIWRRCWDKCSAFFESVSV